VALSRSDGPETAREPSTRALDTAVREGQGGTEEADMRATVGDRLVVEGRKVDDGRREGEVVEVHGKDGAPPYLVRWSDGHEGLTFPGPDAHVVPRQR
jgi:hypothetical protein